MKWWNDITQNAAGHTVAKDLYKALAFFAGLAYLLALVPAVVLLTASRTGDVVQPGIVLPMEPGVTLVLLAFGLQTLKEASNFLNRKTRDADGALAVPGTTDPPASTPKVMPQGPQLAGYSDGQIE